MGELDNSVSTRQFVLTWLLDKMLAKTSNSAAKTSLSTLPGIISATAFVSAGNASCNGRCNIRDNGAMMSRVGCISKLRYQNIQNALELFPKELIQIKDVCCFSIFVQTLWRTTRSVVFSKICFNMDVKLLRIFCCCCYLGSHCHLVLVNSFQGGYRSFSHLQGFNDVQFSLKCITEKLRFQHDIFHEHQTSYKIEALYFLHEAGRRRFYFRFHCRAIYFF